MTMANAQLSRRVALGALASLGTACDRRARGATFAIGYVNNIMNAQALVAALRGTWARELGAALIAFPAGPAVVEALTAGSIDVGFFGPAAAIGAYVRSHGRRLRVLAGAASGGASLVAAAGVGATRAEDFRGRTMTASQIGSTPDVALRGWLAQAGVATRDRGGEVTVVPMGNAEASELLKRRKLDAVWAQEPWASRMVAAGGTRVHDERDLWPARRFPSVLLAASQAAITADPARVRALVAHLGRDTARLAQGDDARDEVAEALARALGKALPRATVADAWSRFSLTTDPQAPGLARVAETMRAIGYLPPGSLDGLVSPREAA